MLKLLIMKISKETPLSEIILRRYEKPEALKERELVKKLCLSIGLLQPGDSRDVVVDVLYVMLKQKKRKKALTCTEIEKAVKQSRKLHKLQMLGIAGSNIRRQLRRLRELYTIEKVGNAYRITENADLTDTFEHRIEKFLLPNIVERVKDYFEKVDEVFS